MFSFKEPISEKVSEPNKEANINRAIIIMIIALVISIIPLLVIGIYDRPSADDFSFSKETFAAWNNQVEKCDNPFVGGISGIGAVVSAAATKALRIWNEWTGDFTTNFLMSLSPCIWGNKAYFVTPFILIFSLIFSVVFLIRKFVTDILCMDRKYSYLVSLPILIVLIQCMVSPSEGFFWFNGGIKYTFHHAVLLCLMGLLIDVFTRETSLIKIVFVSVLAFFVAGGNQISALNGLLLSCLVVLILFFIRKDRIKRMIFPTLFYIAGFLLNVLAPGNSERMLATGGMNPIKSVLVSLFYYFEYCINHWTTWPVILLIIFLIPVFCLINSNISTGFKFKLPGVVIFIGYCLTSATITPVLFGSGSFEAGRTQNITFITYILTLVLSEWYVIGWVMSGIKVEKVKSINSILMFITATFVFAYVLTFIPEPYEYSSAAAISDLRNGSAKQYAMELDEREELFLSGEKEIRISSLTCHPALLFVCDMEGDGNGWIRDAVCKRYNLESIEFNENS